jgi:Fe-S cluster biogenesis protein NfuA
MTRRVRVSGKHRKHCRVAFGKENSVTNRLFSQPSRWIEAKCKTQRPTTGAELFTKDCFVIDLDGDTVTCPVGVRVEITRAKDRSGMASFAGHCATCPMVAQCTKSKAERTISVGVFEGALTRARDRQKSTEWIQDYRATRPTVERKLTHLMQRKHRGQRARVRGQERVAADFTLLAAAANLARLAVLGVHSTPSGWVLAGG